jgi:hypothetical protein
VLKIRNFNRSLPGYKAFGALELDSEVPQIPQPRLKYPYWTVYANYAREKHGLVLAADPMDADPLQTGACGA